MSASSKMHHFPTMHGVDHAKLALWREPSYCPEILSWRETRLTDPSTSRWLTLHRAHFEIAHEEGKPPKGKDWDCVDTRDAVGVLCYHEDKDAFVLIRQFRPPVFRGARNRAARDGKPLDLSSECGMTFELIAGLHMDHTVPGNEVAAAELLEEAGFRVPPSRFRKIATHYSSVGASGFRLECFFVRVTSADEAAEAGGGLLAEGERTEPVLLPRGEVAEFLASSDRLHLPGGLMWALEWGVRETAAGECPWWVAAALSLAGGAMVGYGICRLADSL
jgi:UDP-sugar diphosphatase